MRKAPSPARRGPCRQVCLARQPVHLQKSGSHPERRGKGKFPTPRHPLPSLSLIQTQSAGDSTRALQTPSRSHPERARSPWAQRGTRARALGALFPATVAGRLAPLQGKGEGRMTRKKAERRPGKHLRWSGKRLLSRKRRNGFPAKGTPQGCPSAKCRLSPAPRFLPPPSVLHPALKSGF